MMTAAPSVKNAQQEGKMQHENPKKVSAGNAVELLPLGERGKLRLVCNWDVGIGGGLWSTGLLLTEHLCTHSSFYDKLLRGKRVLELGSGTGLVGLASAMFGPPLEVVITDLASHVEICRQNVAENTRLFLDKNRVRVEEYDWGNSVPVSLGRVPFDVIIGTDLAYFTHLHQPLIKALKGTAGPSTLIILGITRMDTGPDFFDALDKAGFECYLMEKAASNKGFGLFCIFKRQSDTHSP
ncbi:unnamed protein product [Discosporangium mesarthrocarpum]